MKVLFLLIVTFNFCYCQLIEPPIFVKYTPPLNTENIVIIDEPIISQKNLQNYKGLELKNELDGKWPPYNLKLLPSEFYLLEETPKYEYYLTVNKSLIINNKNSVQGVLILSKTGKMAKMAYYEDFKKPSELIVVSKLDKEPQIIKKDTVIVEKEKILFKDFIYLGRVNNLISFGFREWDKYSDKPEVQEFNFDLNNGDIIGHKGMLIKVIEAKNNTLKYKLLKGFD